MLTISARESIRHVVETLVFVAVILVGAIGVIGAGLAVLSTVAPLSAIDRAALVADPARTGTALVAVLGGVSLVVAGMSALVLETVASGVRIGLDRSAALDRPWTPRSVALKETGHPQRVDDGTTPSEDAGRSDEMDHETPDPTEWTERNSVERSRSADSDAIAEEWVFKGDEPSEEADRTA
ncbi:MAG: hypothetical protein ACOCYZ_01285 [Halococcoides sp.]